MAQFITHLSAITGGKKTKVLVSIPPNEEQPSYNEPLPSYSVEIKKGTSPETVSLIKDVFGIVGKFLGI